MGSVCLFMAKASYIQSNKLLSGKIGSFLTPLNVNVFLMNQQQYRVGPLLMAKASCIQYLENGSSGK